MNIFSLSKATSMFMLTTRGSNDKNLDDQHTIVRSWAIKDFAPNVPQFVQNKIHLDFADRLSVRVIASLFTPTFMLPFPLEQLVCEDEFKYAILAKNNVSVLAYQL